MIKDIMVKRVWQLLKQLNLVMECVECMKNTNPCMHAGKEKTDVHINILKCFFFTVNISSTSFNSQ